LDLDPNLLLQANIKIIFPTLLEFLGKYDENGITQNMSNHFRMEIPMSNAVIFKVCFSKNIIVFLGLNDYIREFLMRKK